MSFAAPRGPTGVATILVVGAAVTRADIPVLCADLAELLVADPGGVVVCDVRAARPDLVTVEALARLRMTALRHGRRLVVSGAGPDLLEVVVLLGLTDALPQPGRQAEQREQPLGVEEVVDRRDPSGG
jgi:hypothetical protein